MKCSNSSWWLPWNNSPC